MIKVIMIKVLIIVFSQTGGTQKIADMIQQGIVESKHNCEIINIKETDAKSIKNYDLIGIGCPTFFYREPANVKSFIQKMENSNGKPAFIFCTHGSIIGNTFYYMAEELIRKDFKVIGTFDSYSESSIQFYPEIMHTAQHPDEIELKEAYNFGKEMCNKFEDTDNFKSIKFKLIEDTWWEKGTKNPNSEILRNFFPVFTINSDTCNECKICMDECPVDAIDVFSDPPAIQKEGCIFCWNCEKKCPSGAIEADWSQTIKNSRRNLAKYVTELKKGELSGKFRPYVDYEKII